jgi:hypothetical protein
MKTPFQIKKCLNGIDFEKCAVLFHKHNSYLCDELSKLIFTGALALVGRVT